MVKPTPDCLSAPLSDGHANIWHFGPQSEPVKVVFMHANGFNGLSYKTLLSRLGVHAVAPDMRGHGRTQLPYDPQSIESFQIFADDITEYFERYISTSVILAGHSMGAVSSILAARDLGDKIAGYVGFDPVSISLPGRMFAWTRAGRNLMKRHLPIARVAGRRRAHYESFDAIFSHYQNRGAFKTISDDILKDYLTAGLVTDPNRGGVRLACDPEWEQAIFCAQKHNIFRAAKDLPKNSTMIFGGKQAVSTPLTRAFMARHIGRNNVVYRRNSHHMFPLQETAYCQEVLATILKAARI